MKTVAALLIILSHQGYWFGGQEQTINVRWPIDAKMPAATLKWELRFDKVRIASGQAPMRGDDKSLEIKIRLPTARARTQMQWVYHVIAPGGNDELVSGNANVFLFPSIVLPDALSALGGKTLSVIDQPDGLPAWLKVHKVDFAPITSISQLQVIRSDIVLVGPDQIDDSPFSQQPLVSQAEAGAQILIFQQGRPRTLGGYVLGRRSVSASLVWRKEHPLFDHFESDDLNAWTSDADVQWRPIQLPADEPALELAYWPREVPGKQPVPIDAMVATKTIGKGRLVFCQLPLADWASDPRSQTFLINALTYLCTRPEPTPTPSQRPSCERSIAPMTVPTIKISPGDQL